MPDSAWATCYAQFGGAQAVTNKEEATQDDQQNCLFDDMECDEASKRPRSDTRAFTALAQVEAAQNITNPNLPNRPRGDTRALTALTRIEEARNDLFDEMECNEDSKRPRSDTQAFTALAEVEAAQNVTNTPIPNRPRADTPALHALTRIEETQNALFDDMECNEDSKRPRSDTRAFTALAEVEAAQNITNPNIPNRPRGDIRALTALTRIEEAQSDLFDDMQCNEDSKRLRSDTRVFTALAKVEDAEQDRPPAISFVRSEFLLVCFRLDGIDYPAMASDAALLTIFVEAMKETMAGAAGDGTQPEHMQVAPAAGAIQVLAKMSTDSLLLSPTLQSTNATCMSLARSIPARLQQVTALEKVLIAPIVVSDISASVWSSKVSPNDSESVLQADDVQIPAVLPITPTISVSMWPTEEFSANIVEPILGCTGAQMSAMVPTPRTAQPAPPTASAPEMPTVETDLQGNQFWSEPGPEPEPTADEAPLFIDSSSLQRSQPCGEASNLPVKHGVEELQPLPAANKHFLFRPSVGSWFSQPSYRYHAYLKRPPLALESKSTPVDVNAGLIKLADSDTRLSAEAQELQQAAQPISGSVEQELSAAAPTESPEAAEAPSPRTHCAKPATPTEAPPAQDVLRAPPPITPSSAHPAPPAEVALELLVEAKEMPEADSMSAASEPPDERHAKFQRVGPGQEMSFHDAGDDFEVYSNPSESISLRLLAGYESLL